MKESKNFWLKIKYVSANLISLAFYLLIFSVFTGCTKAELNEKSGSEADITAPYIVSVVPGNSATGVSITAPISVTFSEAVNTATITSTSFTLKQGSTVVPGTINLTGVIATFSPSANLAPNTVYTGTITTAAKDIAGNSLAANYTWSFTTAALADVIAPTITSVTPVVNATSVAVSIKPSVTFSEAIDPSTVTSSTFTLKSGSTSISGNIVTSGTTATFTPSSELAGNTLYTASLTPGIKDAAGNSLASNYSWSFTTIATGGISFASQVVPVLNLCNTCHTHNWTVSSNPSTFHTNLANAGYINTTTPTSGKIYNKLSGGHPPGSTISAAQKSMVLTWITEGSKNN
ncbi:MAG: Ig-like domain-containing protein [Methanococcaceae archaeon]